MSADLLVKKHRRLAKLTDDIVLKQYELDHEHQTLGYCQDFLQRSAEELIDAIEPELAVGDFGTRRNQIVELLSRMKSDSEAFKTQAAHVRGLRSNITQLESRLIVRSKKITDAMNSTTAKRSLSGNEVSDLDLDHNTSSVRTSVHSNTPPLLAEYFSRKGDVGVFVDRLQELDYHHNEGLIERELIADRGDLLRIPDEQYLADYTDQRKTIIDDLSKAKQDVDVLAEKCEAAGMRVMVDLNELSSVPASGDTDSGHGPIAISQSLTALESRPKIQMLAAVRNRSRVRGWLDRLPSSDPGSPNLATEDGGSVESRNTPIRPPKNGPSSQIRVCQCENLSEPEENHLFHSDEHPHRVEEDARRCRPQKLEQKAVPPHPSEKVERVEVCQPYKQSGQELSHPQPIDVNLNLPEQTSGVLNASNHIASSSSNQQSRRPTVAWLSRLWAG